MDQEKKSGFRTLLLSVLMSAPGPLILGLGLRVGHSSTQIADFTRRTAELLALIVALVVYTVTNRQEKPDEERRAALERRGNRFSGLIMCLSGVSMLVLSLLPGSEDKGNVIPALVIAFLGAVANVLFWRKYSALYRRQGNAILGVQARLYGAKSCVDLCVTAALLTLLVFPASPVSRWVDRIGSGLVSLYMVYCGVKTVLEQRHQS